MAAPKRETVASRGYPLAEMANIGKEYLAYREAWTERFRTVMDALIVANADEEPSTVTAKARALVDAEERELADRFGEE